jgi:hypothetical protein
MKYVPSTVICGPHGHAIERGYYEFDCTNGSVRIYDKQMVVGKNGNLVLLPEEIETIPSKSNGNVWRSG